MISGAAAPCAATLLLAARAGAITTDVTGAAIEYMAITESTASVWTASLDLELYTYNGPIGLIQDTRTFNGELVGPTIKVKPGDTLTIQLENKLAAEAHDTSSIHNNYRDLDVTNLHTHGLHVSGEAPGDSIFTEVEAGATNTYVYEIPENHMGGTFWYHPHHHGSTAIHAGGGAAGMMIVADSAGSIPGELANMEEVHLFMQHLNMPEISTISQIWETNCQDIGGSAADCTDPVWAPEAPTAGARVNTVLVNGMSVPTLSLSANKWYRFRLVFAAVDAILTPSLPGCTVMLIAKDGIYLNDAPRTITEGYMGPGNRADWAVSCPTAGDFSIASGARRRRRRMQGGKMAGGGAGNDQIVQTLLQVVVTDNGDAASALSAFNIQKPCYLVDLFGQTPSSTVSFNLGPAPQINNNDYDTSTTYEAAFPVGQVHQLDLTGINAHPFHLHVNSFQITADPADTHGDYFKQGDWHDVMMTPDNAITVRFQTDRYTGKQVIHCHILEHEDEGMMLVTQVTGTEGTLFTGAEVIDPGCYRGFALVSPPFPPGSAPHPPPPAPPLPPRTPPSDEEDSAAPRVLVGGLPSLLVLAATTALCLRTV